MAEKLKNAADRAAFHKGKKTIEFIVSLNGTEENPFLKWDLTMNPFPQLARFELRNADYALRKLAADPIPPDRYEDYIRKVLIGWSEEFIALCLQKYKAGEYVKFTVVAPEFE